MAYQSKWLNMVNASHLSILEFSNLDFYFGNEDFENRVSNE